MKNLVITAAALSVVAPLSAQAADVSTPPVVYAPEVSAPVQHEVTSTATGWYLRGDVGYSYNKLRGATYATSTGEASFTTVDLDESFTAGVGVGYQINSRLRADLTLDYMTKTDFTGSTGPGGPCNINGVVVAAPDCVSRDLASFTAWSLLANAYVDLFTYGRVTGYVGAGLGATYINWSTLHNTECQDSTGTCDDNSIDHAGAFGWRATAALMAGASVKINCAMSADLGYRYRYIHGGRMFQYNRIGRTGPGFHKAIHSHEGRAGLRYALGGCETPIPPYEPPELPPVYK